MGGMMYVRTKVAPWEKYTDGAWHEIRRGPQTEPKDESLRQFRRHRDSMRAWARLNGYRGQISRTGNGRILRVRIAAPASSRDTEHLRDLSRVQIGRLLIEALTLLDCVSALRMHGESDDPAGPAWSQFDRETETLLARIRRPLWRECDGHPSRGGPPMISNPGGEDRSSDHNPPSGRPRAPLPAGRGRMEGQGCAERYGRSQAL